jgi:1,4-dihydroxy-2-naphthoyl-CoA synthase
MQDDRVYTTIIPEAVSHTAANIIKRRDVYNAFCPKTGLDLADAFSRPAEAASWRSPAQAAKRSALAAHVT